MWQGKGQDDEGCGHKKLHGQDPPSFGLDYVHEGAPQGFDDPWEVKEAGEHGHLAVRHS